MVDCRRKAKELDLRLGENQGGMLLAELAHSNIGEFSKIRRYIAYVSKTDKIKLEVMQNGKEFNEKSRRHGQAWKRAWQI